jgi:very-short-patch-repair endonuclease
MGEQWRKGSEGPTPNDKVRVAGVAGQQFGRIGRRQLLRLGVGRATVVDWVKAGYLHPRLPGIYAVGHTAPSVESDLSEALLYAGEGAMLSHATALWWLGILTPRPKIIDISTPGRRISRRNIRIHERRDTARTFHNGLPTTTPAQALLDYAATARLNDLRFALAEAEYRELLDLGEIEAITGRGRHGSAKLRKAAARHQPQLARARSKDERQLVYLCESGGIPVPELNARVGRMTVDAMWSEQRVIVEIDRHRGHRTKAQVERDRRRELHARRHGFMMIRYYGEQLFDECQLVQGDIRGALNLTRSERSA